MESLLGDVLTHLFLKVGSFVEYSNHRTLAPAPSAPESSMREPPYMRWPVIPSESKQTRTTGPWCSAVRSRAASV